MPLEEDIPHSTSREFICVAAETEVCTQAGLARALASLALGALQVEARLTREK